MSSNADLDLWRRQWRAGSPDSDSDSDSDASELAADLAERVARQSRRLKVGLVFPVLVTVIIGGGLALRAASARQPLDIVVAIEGWLFILVTWAGSLWLARGTWRPLAETTVAFLDLCIRRCRANLRAVPFAIALYVTQLVIRVGLALRYADVGIGAVLTAWPVILIGWIGLPAVLIAGLWFARRQRALLEQWLELRRQLDEDASAPPTTAPPTTEHH